MRSITILIMAMALMAGCAPHFQHLEKDAVVFYLKIPDARHVQIAASYNGFALQDAQQKNATTWAVRLPRDLSFRYFYVVDGRVHTPPCEMTEADDFGQINCIYSPPM